LVAGSNPVAADEDPAPFAGELDAVLAPGSADHAGAVAVLRRVGRVGVGDVEAGEAVEAVRLFMGRRTRGRLDLHRAGTIGAETPLGDVVVVRAPVGDLAARVLVPPAKLSMAALLDEFDFGGLAEPEIPIEPGGNGAGREWPPLRVVADPRF